MRKRILQAMIGVNVILAMFAVILGIALWNWIESTTRDDLQSRVARVAEEVQIDEAKRADAGERPGTNAVDLDRYRLLLPENGRLTLTVNAPQDRTRILSSRSIGARFSGDAESQSADLGPERRLTMSVPRADVRSVQWLATGSLVVTVGIALIGGVMAARITARKLAEPLRAVTERAAAMGAGDYLSPWPHSGIDDVDQVADALAEANAEVALRLERESRLVGDVSHQLRSRLTAIHLRFDELTLHSDPAVVAEAEAGLDQVERLAEEMDQMIAAARSDEDEPDGRSDAEAVTRALIDHFAPAFRAAGRRVVVQVDGDDVREVACRPGRLREAMSVLIDNALRHGAGTCTITLADLALADMVRILVTDEGRGVDDGMAREIFLRGFSGSSRSGFGLSLARALIEADGGRLDLVRHRPPSFAIVVPVGLTQPEPPVMRAPAPHR